MAERRRSRLVDALTYGAYRGGAAFTRALPGIVADGLAGPVAFAANVGNAERRAMIARHLRRVDPRLTGTALGLAVQAAFDSYSRYWIETLRLPYLSARTIRKGLTVDGYEHVTTALAGGRGLIMALPHLGGWEWAGRWLSVNGHRLTVIVERLEPPELFEWFADLRSRLGMNVVPLGPDASKEIVSALARNEIVCLLCDRDLHRHGVEVEFFGERTTLPAGPATLALRTGAPLVAVGVYFTNRYQGHHGVVRPPMRIERRGKLREDVARITQDLAHELEHLIRRAPSQWHLFQPNWPSDPGYGA